MTTERQEASQAPELAPQADGLDFEIEDSTPPEVVEAERRFLAGESQPAEEAEQPEVESEVQTPEEEAPPEPQAVSPTPVEPEPQPEQPAARTYSEEEWRKAQGSWQRQIDEARKREQEAQQRLSEFDLNAQVEATLRRQEQQLEQQVGVEEARRQVRSYENEQNVRQGVQNAQRVKQLEAQVQQSNQQWFHTTLGSFIQDRAQKLNLSPRQAERLMSLVGQHSTRDEQGFAATGNAIASMADEFAELNKSSSQARQQRRDRVPPETPATQLETGQSTGPGRNTVDQEMDRIMDKPTWQWTDQELDFFRKNK